MNKPKSLNILLKLVLIFILPLFLLFFFYNFFLFVSHDFNPYFLQIDRCLDAGNVWDHQGNSCKKASKASVGVKNFNFQLVDYEDKRGVSFSYPDIFTKEDFLETDYFFGDVTGLNLISSASAVFSKPNTRVKFAVFLLPEEQENFYLFNLLQLQQETGRVDYLGEPLFLNHISRVKTSDFTGWQVDVSTTNIGGEMFFQSGKYLFLFSYDCVSDLCLKEGELFFSQVKGSFKLIN